MSWLTSGTPPHWVWFAVGLYELLNEVLPKIDRVRANTVIQAVFNVLNIVLLRLPGVAQVVSVLDTPEPADKPAAVPPPVPPAAALLFFLAATLALPGCTYCTGPAHAAEAKCVAYEVLVDCGPATVVQVAASLVTPLFNAISGSAVDWGVVGQLETKNGIGAVACAAKELDAATTTQASLKPSPLINPLLRAAVAAHRDAVHLHAGEYMASRRVKVL